MTKKGLKKLVTRPHIFVQDFLRKKMKKKEAVTQIEVKKVVYDIHSPSNALFYAYPKVWSLQKEVLDEQLKQHAYADEYYRLAQGFEEVYNWIDASIYYKKAWDLKPYQEDWALHLGAVYERLENWKSAMSIYAFLGSNSPDNREYIYRLGYVLAQAKEYALSCDAFLLLENKRFEQIIEKQPEKAYKQLHCLASCEPRESEFWLTYLKLTLGLGIEQNLKEIYQKYFLYAENFNPEIYYLQAKHLTSKKNYQEATQLFIEQKIVQKAYSFSLDAYKNRAFKKVVDYTEYYERHVLEKKMVLYEINHGESIEGEVYSLFKTIYSDERFVSYVHIWVLNDNMAIPTEYKESLNVIFIKRESDLYLRYLTKAKYLINNKTFPSYFIRKKRQLYLNLSLAQPIYGVLNKIDDADMSRNLLHSTHQKIRDIDDLFFNTHKEATSSKKSILFYAGNFDRNHKTTAFVTLMNTIDTDKYAITICLDPTAIKKSKVRREAFKRIKSRVSIVPRLGRMLMTLEEKYIREKFESQSYLEDKVMWAIYKKTYSREYRRVFGESRFDLMVHFEGESIFWQSMFAYGINKGGDKIIYQHHNMEKLWKTDRPKLQNNFILYREFDKIVSVSEDLMAINRTKLAKKFDLKEQQFTYINRLIFVPKRELPLNLSLEEKNMFEKNQVFINIGRFTRANNQAVLIEAFKEVIGSYSNVRLILIGSGKEEESLLKLIKKLKLEERVSLWKEQEKSELYLEVADALIVASSSEKQPFILREAFLMKKTIISTKLIGKSELLKNSIDFLVEDNKEGLVKGIFSFLDKRILEDKEYNQNLFNEFYAEYLD